MPTLPERLRQHRKGGHEPAPRVAVLSNHVAGRGVPPKPRDSKCWLRRAGWQCHRLGRLGPLNLSLRCRGYRVLFGVQTLWDLASDNSEMTLLGRIFRVLATSCLAQLHSDAPTR
jgi:hypothetical protein